MKLKLLTTLSLCLAVHCSVCASEIVINDVTFEGNKVFVSGVDKNPGNTITAKVLPTSSDESSFSDAVLVRETKSNDEGIFKFDFVMPDTKNTVDTSGNYTVYINFEGSDEIKTKSFDFVSSGMRSGVIGVLQTGSVSDIKDLLENEEKKLIIDGIGIDLVEFNALNQNKEKCLILLQNENDLSTFSESEIRDAVNKAIDVASLAISEIESVGKHLTDLNPTFKTTEYTKITDTSLINWINSLMAKKEFTTYVDYEKQYRDANALYLVNNARYSALMGIIDENNDSFGLLSNETYKKYLNLRDETYQRIIDEQVVLSLKSKPAYTVTEFVELYENKIKETLASMNSRPSGGGSSGGGGGSSSGGSSSGNKGGTITLPVNVEIGTKPSNQTEAFSDLGGYDWAKDAIIALKEEGIVSGYPDGSFMPSKVVNREEFVKMLITALGIKEFESNNSFADVVDGAWYEPYINTAVAKGIVAGVDENQFGIGQEISRQQMAVLVYRASNAMGLTNNREYSEFSDEHLIDDYAKEAVRALYCAGKINGVGSNMFAPEKGLTRAEAAKVIYEIFLR